MLSELSGTSLAPGEAWDREASERLAAFQRAEGLPATGAPDDPTLERLELRFSMAAASREASAPQRSPSSDAHARVAKFIKESASLTEHVAKEIAPNSPLRARYVSEVRAYSSEILARFEAGTITEGEAALLASSFRNQCLNETRRGLTPAGLAVSRYLKEEGVTLPELVARYSSKMYGKAPSALTAEEHGAVCLKIAERAGVTNGVVNGVAKAAPIIGKAMLAASVAIAFYQVATAEDPVREGVKQAASAAGFWAGAAIGAEAGLLCGPMAWVCSPLGGLITGVAAASLAEQAVNGTYTRIKG